VSGFTGPDDCNPLVVGRAGRSAPYRSSVPLSAADWLVPTRERPDPINRAFGRVGRAIGEGAERGDAFGGGRAGMGTGCGGEPVECFPCDLKRRVERAMDG